MLLRRLIKLNDLNAIKRYYSNRNILKLKERGMFQDLFPDTAANDIVDLLNSSPQSVYAGFDPTADSLHIGNLLVLINLIHWQRAGHQSIALIGGATAKIGDPSGRSTEREELGGDFIDRNIDGIRKNIETIFHNHQEYIWKDQQKLKPLIIVNNEDWYSKISAVQLIGNIGRHLRMGTLLGRTSVQTRLQSPAGMSYTEFSYQLFQAYDWLHLFKQYKCLFQIGGNDQMGNIVSGHDLISKMCKQSVYGLTVPIITTEMGDKFGKSAGNAMWLSPNKTSPFVLYQFFIRQTDREVEKLLKLFTFDHINVVEDLLVKHRNKPDLRLAQKYLAKQILLLVHGENGLKLAEQTSQVLYNGDLQVLSQLNTNELIKIFDGASFVEILPEAGLKMIDLAMRVRCFPTIDDALRIIKAGGFYINYQRCSNPEEVLNMNVHRLANNITLLRVGKRNYYVVKWAL